MQPLKITILGDYYDSYIYSGMLFLWKTDGSIGVYHWEAILELLKNESDAIAITCAFKDSRYLYNKSLTGFFRDIEIKNIVERKFERLSKQEFVIDSDILSKCAFSVQENKFPSPHSAIGFYNNRLYVSSKEGVWSANTRAKTKHFISSNVQKKSDISVLDFDISYATLAISSGADGLYELYTDEAYDYIDSKDAYRLLSNGRSDRVSWNYYSIYSSSYNDPGYMARFHKEKTTYRHYKRLFDEIVGSERFFGLHNYSWGVHDKICMIEEKAIEVVKYEPWNLEEIVRKMGTIRSDRISKEDFVTASSSYFGIILEFGNHILVITSDENYLQIDGEPVNWRVFNKSKQYENQLHVVFDDRLEVYSFNQDYFIDQSSKLVGSIMF